MMNKTALTFVFFLAALQAGAVSVTRGNYLVAAQEPLAGPPQGPDPVRIYDWSTPGFWSLGPLGPFVAADPAGNMYASSGGGVIHRFDAASQPKPNLKFDVYSLDTDAAGNLYALGPLGQLTSFAPDGAVLQKVSLPYTGPYAPQGMSVTPDGCNIHYFVRPMAGVNRYDLCHGTSLSPISTPRYPDAIRALSDNGVVAVVQNDLLFYGPDGVLVRDITVGDSQTYVTSLAFDTNPGIVLVGTGGAHGRYVERLRLYDGVEVGNQLIGDTVWGLAVVGEQRPASTAALPAAVPSLSTYALLLLGVTLTALAWRRLG